MHTNTRTHARTHMYTHVHTLSHTHTHHQAAAMHIFRHMSLVGDLVLVVLEHVIRFTPVTEKENDESEQQESTSTLFVPRLAGASGSVEYWPKEYCYWPSFR